MGDDFRLEPSADSAARASVTMWRLTVEAIAGAWIDEREGAAAVFTGIEQGGFNGVWTTRADAAPEVVAELLDDVAATGVPYSLHLREGSSELADLARHRGMLLDAEEPLMILEDASALGAALEVPDLRIRRLGPHEGRIHAEVAASVFGDSLEVTEAGVTPAILSSPGVRCYAGSIGGEVVATVMGVTHSGTVAVFALATLADHRRRGYGAALTARAVLDGFPAGASWAWLEASEEGVGVYERLGFRAVETVTIWVSE
jgi:ribosomal protein S18 acetylase RimI-like enzyme